MGTPLWWAAHYGSAEVCRSLLQSGARLDVGGGDLRSPNTMMMNDNDYEPMRKYIANYLWSFLFLRNRQIVRIFIQKLQQIMIRSLFAGHIFGGP